MSAHEVSINLGGTTVLDGVSATIEPGDRIGLVGPNGAGKTTFLRMLAAELEPDKGEIAKQKSLRIGYLEQRPEPPEDMSVLAWVLDAFGDVAKLERELEKVHEKLETASPEDMERLLANEARLREKFEAAGGYDIERRAEAALTALGVPTERFHDDPKVLSGGERARVALARALVREPDILLLDEPTNHLDLAALEWLEERLATGKEAIVVVSHDRYLLDSLATSIWELRGGHLKMWTGNYSEYREKRDMEDQRLRHERDKFDRKVAKEMDFIRKNIAGQKTRQAKGRKKVLERRLEQDGAPELLAREGGEVRLQFEDTRRAGEVTLAVDKLRVGYEGLPPLISGLDLEVRRGERVGIVGPNGCGKTTFLRTVLGELVPERGTIKLGHNVRVGYYRQEGEDLPPAQNAISATHDKRPTAKIEEIRDLLGALGLSGEKQETLCGALSGGERARVSLARVILDRPNVLILDEPTNHLDIQARHALEEALSDFEGSIVTVSHDRWFLDEVATKMLAFEAPGAPPRVYPGGYTEYRARRLREDAQARVLADEQKTRDREKKAAQAPAPAKAAAPRKKKRTLHEVEARVMELEDERSKLHASLSDEATYKDPAKIKTVRDELTRVETELADANAEWEQYASEG